MKPTERPHRILYRVVSGNVEGIVEQPDDVGSGDQLRVLKIAVLNSAQPLDEDDARFVIDQLRTFRTTLASPVSS